MTTAAVVQARMSSTRLPGKVMLDLAGQPVLSRVLRGCQQIKGVDVVVCAMPDTEESQPLEELARECGVLTSRGSEMDVLDRYLRAAENVRADIIMRVTSDCPLLDPSICSQVLRLMADKNVQYACNNMPRTFPHGLDCEVMTIEALREAAENASQPFDREHVTPWLRRAPNIGRANLRCWDTTLARNRWTLDYPEDFDFFKAVFAKLPKNGCSNLREVLHVLDTYPEIIGINLARGECGNVRQGCE